MDLVDIDQVLDNLELREAADERQKAAEAAAVAPAAPIVSRATETNGGLTPKTKAPTKSFVGVSQVFNSLDDYCRNVESLETATPQTYDEECRPIERSMAERPAVQNIEQYTPYHNDDDVTVANDADEDENDDDDDDDDDEVCNDIEKFVERKCKQSCDRGDGSSDSLSESITTSSPSTFSSGPSPGLASTTTDEQLTTPMSPLDDEELRPLHPSQEHDDNDGDEGVGMTHQLDNENDDEREDVTELSANPAEPGSSAVLEDLAYGLSSISITTANSHLNLPAEASVSSALGNVLDELTETTTSSQISQQRDEPLDTVDSQPVITGEASLVSTSPQYQPEVKQEEHNEEDVPGTSRAALSLNKLAYPVAEPPQPAPVKLQQPITFGSTMDEISDTELDSMLQEMDVDEVPTLPPPNRNHNNNNVIAQPEAINGQTVEEQLDLANDYDPSEYAEDCSDCLNADSFSQASTVEFSEIRAAAQQAAAAAAAANAAGSNPPAGGHDDELAVSSNSAVSSYTSSESSLDADYSANDADGGDGDGGAQSRPQRPTSLDLPALKMRYANAGQTPPPGAAVMTVANGESSVDVAPPAPPPPQPSTETLTEAVEGQTVSLTQAEETSEIEEASGHGDPHANLGKVPPIWVPDNMASGCMQCHTKFTMIKRRHHCRACGKVLCSVCCSQKFKLEYLANPQSRVCVHCYLILTQRQNSNASQAMGESVTTGDGAAAAIASDATGGDEGSSPVTQRSPNPNNPMEYCSTIPPHRQVSATSSQPPPSVIVPVGVLKKEGSYSSTSSNSSGKKGRKRKSVMFSDGIAPGSDLACMEYNQWADAKHARRGQQQAADKSTRASSASPNKPATPGRADANVSDSTAMGLVSQLFRGAIPPIQAAALVTAASAGNQNSSTTEDVTVAPAVPSDGVSTDVALAQRSKRVPPSGCDEYGSFIPSGKDSLPPIYVSNENSSSSCDYDYKDVANNFDLVERLQRETLKFAVQNNFYVFVKIMNLNCCMNRTVINFTTCGMQHVGNDEIIILLEYNPPATKDDLIEPPIPKDIFVHLLDIYREADHGNPIAELSYTSPRQSNFLGSHEYGGFIFIRTTFQCLQDVIVPENPYLIGILIHRSEVPWAKIFPLRLMLRLGAQYRYYPCPHVSIRSRESVYADIAQTIINFLADFRNYSYTLPSIRGMVIHMEDRQTTVLIPRNRLDDVIKAINNSSDHILAFGGNFSKTADGHLVCMQNVNDDRTEMYSYSTQAINIQGQPRRVTGASFFVLNEALKTTSGLSGKCSIVEDGLMVQILPTKMEEVRNSLRNQKDIDIVCGPLNAEEHLTEVVSIKWVENDRDFNVGVKSPIDEKLMDGIASMRVHANFNYANTNYSIRLTDIYILKFDDWYNETLTSMSVDITRISEQIAKSASLALVPFLDLLAANKNRKIGLRATLNQDNVCYEAGTRGSKLPPLYMNALDNHLVPVLHNESNGIEETIILELIFYILNI